MKMGSMLTGLGKSYLFEGYLIHEIEYSLYCDRCGSFKLGRRITLRTIVVLVPVAALAAVPFWILYRAAPEGWSGFLGGLLTSIGCFALLVTCLAAVGVLKWGYRCRQCGNRRITWGDLRNDGYSGPELDVPRESTIKRYVEDEW